VPISTRLSGEKCAVQEVTATEPTLTSGHARLQRGRPDHLRGPMSLASGPQGEMIVFNADQWAPGLFVSNNRPVVREDAIGATNGGVPVRNESGGSRS
jgi:hypothetical protein